MLLYVMLAPSATAGGSALTVALVLWGAAAAGPVNARTGWCGADSGQQREGLEGECHMLECGGDQVAALPSKRSSRQSIASMLQWQLRHSTRHHNATSTLQGTSLAGLPYAAVCIFLPISLHIHS